MQSVDDSSSYLELSEVDGVSVYNATPNGIGPLKPLQLLSVTTNFGGLKPILGKKQQDDPSDIFGNPCHFCFDNIPEDASKKAKAIDDLLESLNIQQVCMRQVMDSLTRIESSNVQSCFDQLKKSPSKVSLCNQSDKSSLRSLPLSVRRKLQMNISKP